MLRKKRVGSPIISNTNGMVVLIPSKPFTNNSAGMSSKPVSFVLIFQAASTPFTLARIMSVPAILGLTLTAIRCLGSLPTFSIDCASVDVAMLRNAMSINKLVFWKALSSKSTSISLPPTSSCKYGWSAIRPIIMACSPDTTSSAIPFLTR